MTPSTLSKPSILQEFCNIKAMDTLYWATVLFHAHMLDTIDLLNDFSDIAAARYDELNGSADCGASTRPITYDQLDKHLEAVIAIAHADSSGAMTDTILGNSIAAPDASVGPGNHLLGQTYPTTNHYISDLAEALTAQIAMCQSMASALEFLMPPAIGATLADKE